MLGELLQEVSLKEKYPILEQVDLVIEGAVGGNRAMAYAAKFLFPDALYVGADLHPLMIPMHKMRLSGSFDPQTFKQVQEANKSDGLFPEGALVCADCFDKDLVQDIMQRGACRFPLLVSIDGLPFLLSHLNAGDRKPTSDYHSIENILSRKTPFIGQLHVASSQLWHDDGPKPGNEGYYYALEESAQAMGWISDRLPNALILLR